jgi:hypothetical protein
MFKRGISLLLGMAMLLSCLPVSFAETGESAAVSAEPSAAAPSAALSAQTAVPAAVVLCGANGGPGRRGGRGNADPGA